MTRRDVTLLSAGFVALCVLGYVAGIFVTEVLDDFLADEVDLPALRWLAEHRTSFWTSFMRAATGLGNWWGVAFVTTVGAFAAYVTTRQARWSAFIVFAGLGGGMLDKILKPLVGRARPELDPVYEVGGRSFPSGHATAVTALWLALALFVYLRWRKKWVWPVALGVILLVLFTRPYLGVHHPTDVVAGAALSTGWVLLCLRFTHVGDRPPPE
jgi:membrane-associated phospholipid phosphatase